MLPPRFPAGLSFFEHAFRDSPLAAIIIDTGVNILYWNAAATRLFGWTAAEAAGRTLPFVPPEFIEEHREMHQRVLDGAGFMGRRIVRQRKDGARLSLSLNTWPLRGLNGQVIGGLLLYTDLSEEQRDAEALRSREALAIEQIAEFQRFYATAPIGLGLLDTEFRFVRVNERLAQIHGLSVEDHAGKTLNEVSPEIAELLGSVCREVMATGIPVIEKEVRAATGGLPGVIRDWQVSLHPFKQADGTVLGVTTVVSDITERKQLIEQIKRQETLLRLVVDGIPGLVAYVDRDHRYRLVNKAYHEWFRRPAAEIEGRLVREILGEENFTAVESHLARVFRGETVVFELQLQYADRLRDVRVSYVPDRTSDGTIRGTFVLVQDITEQKRAERALRDREEQLRGIVEISAEGIWTVDPEGRPTFANSRMSELLGFSREEFMSRTFIDFLEPDERERAQRCFEHRKEGDASPREYRFRHKDGRTVWLDITASAMRDHEGVLTGVLGMCTDVTERKQREQQLRQTQKLEGLGILAGGIAHDFNNLLVGIMGNASLALDRIPPESAARTMLKDVIAASEHAAQLTRQLLEYAGRNQTEMETLDLGSLVRDLIPLVTTSISRMVTLRLELDEAPPVDADPSQMQQVVMNLVINAAESIPERAAGVVRIQVAQRELTDEDRRGAVIPIDAVAAKWVMLSVSDTGSGMDGETQSRIFDPFFTTKFEGRGLGLSAVLGIVKRHQGTLTVNSVPGKGATFTVLLPASQGSVRPKLTELSMDEVAGYGAVLIVDDEPSVRTMARRTLELQGYRVVAAENGQQGVEALAANPDIRAVVLDLTMPVMGGDAAAAAMHALRPDVPLILSSGYREEESGSSSARRFARGFLPKPYLAETLLRKLAAALADSSSVTVAADADDAAERAVHDGGVNEHERHPDQGEDQHRAQSARAGGGAVDGKAQSGVVARGHEVREEREPE